MTHAGTKPQPKAYAVKDAAEAIGISAALLEQIISRGDINVRWINSKRVIPAGELDAYLEALPYDRPGVAS